MSLTKNDLKAISTIVNDAIDDSKLQTAAGFAAVDAQFAKIDERFDNLEANLTKQIQAVDDKLTVKDNKLEDTVQRVDRLMQHVGIV